MRRAYWLMVLALCLGACGGSSNGPTVMPTPTPVPGAAVSVVGNGALEVHPSADTVWAIKLLVPIRIQETGGGTASWNYARVSLWNGAAEVERGEIGADVLATPPDWTSITARQNNTYTLVYGFNSDDFDTVTMTLGFSDRKDGRQFTADVPFESFSDVVLSFEPLNRPASSVQRID